MRCGTSALWLTLADHPQLKASGRKEVHFFDHHFDRGLRWYRSFFPIAPNRVMTFESTPSYLVSEGAALRVKAAIPNVLVVVLLREPAERAWSHYRLRRSERRDTRSFEEAIAEEISESAQPLMTLNSDTVIPYLTGGMYADQLVPWFDSLGRKRVLVLDANAMFKDPNSTVVEIENFLGLEHAEIRHRPANAAPLGEPPDVAMSRLSAFYRDPNERLAELLDTRLSWL